MWRRVGVVLASAGCGLLAVSALAGANAVPGTRAGSAGEAVTAQTLKPSECAAIVLAAIVTGNGTVAGGNLSELVAGGSGADSLDGGKGDDCILGGGGNDSLRGSQGFDVCIGGPGVDTFHASCEIQIQ